MLSRRWTLIVLAGWLVVSAVFVVRDLRPRWTTEEPAAFAISIGDEPKMSFVGAPKERQVETSWRILRNGFEHRGDQAASRIQYNHWSDTLEVGSSFKLKTTPSRRQGQTWLEVSNKFRVDWEGRLQEFEAELRLHREPLLLTNPAIVAWLVGSWLPGLTEQFPEWVLRRPFPFEARVPAALVVGAWLQGLCRLHPDFPKAFRAYPAPQEERAVNESTAWTPKPTFFWTLGGRSFAGPGRQSPDSLWALYTDSEVWARCRSFVRKGHFLPHWRISGETRDPVFSPVALSAGGHLYLPFHPFNRLPGLKAGQRWSMPMLDLEAAVNLGSAREVRTVAASVEETPRVEWQNRWQQVWLMTIRDAEREVGRVWVRKSDYLVLRQELQFSGDRYVLERDVSRDNQLRGP